MVSSNVTGVINNTRNIHYSLQSFLLLFSLCSNSGKLLKGGTLNFNRNMLITEQNKTTKLKRPSVPRPPPQENRKPEEFDQQLLRHHQPSSPFVIDDDEQKV